MISFQNVTKVYPPDHVVLRDVTFSLSRGEFVHLSGPAGCGKSVVIRMVLCQEKPTRGVVNVFGRKLSDLQSKEIPFLRRRIGYISQEPKLMRPRTVFENLTCVLHATGILDSSADQKAKAMLTLLGLENFSNRFTSDLSRSQEQKLLIARALIVQPAILLADEPLAHLEKEDVGKIQLLFADSIKQGAIIVWASQSVESFPNVPVKTLELKEGNLTVKEAVTPVNPPGVGPVSSEDIETNET